MMRIGKQWQRAVGMTIALLITPGSLQLQHQHLGLVNAAQTGPGQNDGMTMATKSSPCSLCRDGANITHPDKVLSLKGFEFITSCGMLVSVIGGLFQQGTDMCTLLQGIGSICGCPNVPDNACYLCGQDSLVGYPQNEMAFLADQLAGFVPTCEIYDAFLRSEANTSSWCDVSKLILGQYCGCGVTPIVEDRPAIDVRTDPPCTLCKRAGGSVERDMALNIEGFPLKTCGALEDAVSTLFTLNDDGAYELDFPPCEVFSNLGGYCGCETPEWSSCTLCHDGSTVLYPDKRLSETSALLYGFEATCEHLEAMVKLAEGPNCWYLQQLGGPCGCPSQDSAVCVACVTTDPSFLPDKLINVNGFGFQVGIAPLYVPCHSLIESVRSASSEFCYSVSRYAFLCGCEHIYLGANSPAKRAALAWVPRVSGTLSLLGSLYIIVDCARIKTKRMKVLPQLLIMMSVFDVFGSVAYVFSTLPIPAYDPNGNNEGILSGPADNLAIPIYINSASTSTDVVINGPIYGAHGNDATCTAQAFFIQLGYTALWFNFAISVYYMLSIVHSWSELRMKKIRLGLYGVPLLIGVGLAFACIPFAGPTYSVCWIPDLKLVIIFGIVPIFSGIAMCTLCMGSVCHFVIKQSRASRRWTFSATTVQSTSQNFSWRRNASAPASDGTNTGGHGEVRQSRGSFSRRPSQRAGPNTSVQNEVLYQSFYYLASFYITWSVALIPHFFFRSQAAFQSYWLWILWVTFAPLQGFWNALVYLRPRWKQKQREAALTRAASTSQQMVVGSFWARFRFGVLRTPRDSEQDRSMRSSTSFLTRLASKLGRTLLWRKSTRRDDVDPAASVIEQGDGRLHPIPASGDYYHEDADKRDCNIYNSTPDVCENVPFASITPNTSNPDHAAPTNDNSSPALETIISTRSSAEDVPHATIHGMNELPTNHHSNEGCGHELNKSTSDSKGESGRRE